MNKKFYNYPEYPNESFQLININLPELKCIFPPVGNGMARKQGMACLKLEKIITNHMSNHKWFLYVYCAHLSPKTEYQLMGDQGLALPAEYNTTWQG